MTSAWGEISTHSSRALPADMRLISRRLARISCRRSLSSRAATRSSVCLVVKAAHLFFQEKVDGHADRGQGRLKLVGDRPDDVPLQLVLLAELGHVSQDQDDAGRPAFQIQDGDAVRPIEALGPGDELLEQGRAVLGAATRPSAATSS